MAVASILVSPTLRGWTVTILGELVMVQSESTDPINFTILQIFRNKLAIF